MFFPFLTFVPVQPLDIVLIENRGQGLYPFEERPDLLQLVAFEYLRGACGLKHVVLENIPAGEAQVLKFGQRNKVLNQRRPRIRALAQANGSHLGKRADRLRNTFADRFHAGDEGGGDRPHPGNHDAQFSFGRLNL